MSSLRLLFVVDPVHPPTRNLPPVEIQKNASYRRTFGDGHRPSKSDKNE
ncbi:unnamed protein product [Spirodela intermedia]|uniref:Uncharacterized protein n=2 Tax=Spirodela intermedia TaxID=51605 RepID=A0A7I8KKH9_SPIIN|nr:unnamed protein product [Spirodela intermedia]CAA6661925.1 unnamed protein product [Spirodela intermedia]CAA7398297.1 unnamed protein product [Spirodela intermedia]